MKKIVVFFICLFCFLPILPKQILNLSTNQNKEIRVEVRGAVDNPGFFMMERFSTLETLFTQVQLNVNARLSGINLMTVLKNEDVIDIPYRSEVSKISINFATSEQLMKLKGIGPKTAEAILTYRQENGLFQVLEDLMNVSGIGPKTFEKLKSLISL